MRRILKGLLLAGALGTSPAFAALLLVDSNTGQLIGAENVIVGSSVFDVEFLGGTCDSLFDGCSQSAFAFDSADDAVLAAQALLDQVFVDTPQGLFDSDPSLISGCFSQFGCSAFTAYGSTSDTVFLSSASNFRPGAGVVDRVAIAALDLDGPEFTEPAFLQTITFARWTAIDVAAPSALPTLAASLVALALVRRRKVRSGRAT